MRAQSFLTSIAVMPFLLRAATATAQLPPPDLGPGDRYRVLFVTSTASSGDLGGVFGADILVNQAAQSEASVLRGFTFKAVLSSSGRNAVDRFLDDEIPIYNSAGERLATRVSELFRGDLTALEHQPWYDESGTQVGSPMLAWTGSSGDGTGSGRHCAEWTTNDTSLDGSVGHPDLVSSDWLAWGTLNCVNPARLYALSDPVTAGGQGLFVPAAASAHGRGGTFWSTSAWIVNASDESVAVRAGLLLQGGDNTSAVQHPETLGTIPPHGLMVVGDLVGALGGSEVTGGVYLTAGAQGQVLPPDTIRATTYTWTPNPNGPGAYGQGIPAVQPGGPQVVYLAGLFQTGSHRTNIGVLNTSGEQISLRIELFGPGGQPLGSPIVWKLKPFEQRQEGLPALGVTSLDGGSARVSLSTSAGSFAVYSSTVDEATGDAAYNAAR